MGGGDLNTKKSWHPNTMKNQERVWKAEQAEANEKRRIDDLRREMDSERSREELTAHGQTTGVLVEKANKKMDWMYKQPHESVDREQYLLGKKIDKTFEKIVSEEKANTSYVKPPPKNHVEHECIPFSIRNLSADVAPSDCQVDMARKLLEDPLVAIRKRELESRAQLLQNPVKLKELTMLLKMDQAETKKKKDKKKSKKHKKGSSDIDKKLAEKLNKLKKGHEESFDLKGLLQSPSEKVSSKKKKKKKKSSSSSESESEEETQPKEKHESRKRSGEAGFDRGTSGPKDKRSKYDQSEEDHRKSYQSYDEGRYERSNGGDHRKTHKSYNRDRCDNKREDEQRKSHKSNNEERYREEDSKSYKSNNEELYREDQRKSHKIKNEERHHEEEQRRSHKSNNGERHREEEQRKPHKSKNDERHHEEEKRISHKSNNDERHHEDHKKSKKSKHEGRAENSSRPAIIISQKYNEDSDEEGATPKEKHYGLVRADGSKIHSSKTKRQTPPKVLPSKDVKKYEKVRPIKLTEAEKEEKRKEMMNNANERDKEREKYVSNYRDQEKKQEAKEKKHKYKDDFVEKHLREAAKFTSLESRVKSNIYNIQRANRHMDTNFAKR